jgi:hypothetical protein
MGRKVGVEGEKGLTGLVGRGEPVHKADANNGGLMQR